MIYTKNNTKNLTGTELQNNDVRRDGEKKPIIRTIAGAARYFKEQDPDSPFTQNLIREAIKNGFKPARKVNRRTYVDVNKLMDYFSGVDFDTVDTIVEDKPVEEEVDEYKSLWISKELSRSNN